MRENEYQGFAAFFGRASLGRKLGAVLSWLAVICLIAALFVPMFSLLSDAEGVVAAVEQSNLESTGKKFLEQNADLLTAGQKETMGSLYGGEGVSLWSYLSSAESALSGSGTVGILLLGLYILLLVAIIPCGLFTMNVLNLAFVLSCGVEVILVYFLRITKATSQLVDKDALVSAHSSVLFWLLIGLAVVLAVVGVVLHYVLHEKEQEDAEDDYGENDEGREDETGLVGEPSAATVAVLKRLNTDETFPLLDNSVVLLGKNPEQADIVISNPVISRVHAKVTCTGGKCFVEDMGSSNGTFVDDQRLTKGAAYALSGDTYITLGNEILLFHEER